MSATKTGTGPPLRILLLGELSLLRGNRPIALPASKKTRALCGYLAAAPRSHLRERLCELLWDGPDDPRAALRWSLTKIRPLLDDERATRLIADRERVALEPEGAEVDLISVQALLAGGIDSAGIDALRAAAARFRGELLEGLDLPDCHRYHAWCVGERDRARGLRLSILAALVERLQGRPEEALRFARDRVAVDPVSEAAHAQVVRLLGRLGRGREALKQYETCRRILDSELGARPSGELERARASITAPDGAQPAVSAAIPPEAPPAPPSEPPSPTLFGREGEVAAIEAQLGDAARGEAREVLLFVGEPGIGKSRLLEELTRRVRSAGGLALEGRAFETEMVRPYGAWIDALRSSRIDVPEPLRRDLAPLLPELDAGAPAGGDRSRLFDAVARLLTGLAGAKGPPCALVIDDVHWLDEASAALLHFVARAATGSRLLIACGARPGELADNPPALRVVRALARDQRLREIPLEPLAAAATADLMRSVLPGIDPSEGFAASAGNPLYALEIARARERGHPSSDTLDGLLHDRIEQLDERSRELLPWAAALGHGFEPDLLARATGLPAAQLLSAIEDLEHRGILRPTSSAAGAPAYDFAHDLMRQAAYRRLSEPRRRMVHLQIARSLDGIDDPTGALAGDLAHHASLGALDELAARACAIAGERSLGMFAHEEALALVQRGLRHTDGLPRDTRIRLQVALLKVATLARYGDPAVSQVEASIEALGKEAAAAGLRTEVSLCHFLLSAIHVTMGQLQRTAIDSLRQAEVGRQQDPQVAIEALGNAGFCLALIGREVPRADGMLTEATDLARQFGLQPTPDVPGGIGLVLHYQGRADEAAAMLEQGARAAHDSGRHWQECSLLAALVVLELERRRYPQAIAACDVLAKVAHRMGAAGGQGALVEALRAVAQFGADEAGAGVAIERAIEALRAVDNKAFLAELLGLIAEIEIARGAPERARPRLEEALAAAETVDRPSAIGFARALLSRLDLESGDRKAGRRRLEPVLPLLAIPGMLSRRAALAVEGAARALRLAIPTLIPTVAATTGL